MNTELQEYKNYEEEVRDTLESQYQMAMFNGDLAGAYATLGKLMEFKLIDVDDARIEKNNKTYAKGGIDPKHRFVHDYRKDTNYIPKWLFGDVKTGETITFTSTPHWGKRVEGNYEGDAYFNARPVGVRISLCNTNKKVENAFDRIDTILGKSKKFNKAESVELCKAGVHRVYEMEVQGVCASYHKEVGYAIIKMGEQGVDCSLILQYRSLVGNWVNVENAVKAIKDAMRDIADVKRFATVIKPEKAIAEFNAQVAASNAVQKNHDERLKKQES